MEKTIRSRIIAFSKETAILISAIVAAVLLPQMVHGIGVVTGVGGMLGQILLPMYIPVFVIGFYRGPVSGILTGLFAPLISFWMTGMPAMNILPYMMIELIAIGALAGLLAKSKGAALWRVLMVQAGAKAVRSLIFAGNLYFATEGALTVSAVFGDVVRSIPGILLQLVVVTVLLKMKEKEDNV